MAVKSTAFLEVETTGQSVDLVTTKGANSSDVVIIGNSTGVTKNITTLNLFTSGKIPEGQMYFIFYDPTDITYGSSSLMSIFGRTLTDVEASLPLFITAIYNHITLQWDVGIQLISNHNGNVATANIADLAVTTAKIAALAVDSTKIADLAVTTIKIADLNVTEAKILDAAITTAKIKNANVTSDKIANLAILTGKINDLAVTTAKINDLAVTAAKIADATITRDKLTADAKRQYISVVIPILQSVQYVPLKTMLNDGSIEACDVAVTADTSTDDLTATLKIEGAGTKTVGSVVIASGTATANTNTAMTIAASPTNEFEVGDRLVIDTSKTIANGAITVSISYIID